MNSEIYQQVRENPKFHDLVKRRRVFALKLSSVIFCVYYLFILSIAFWPDVLGTKLSDGVTTVGIPVGIGIILLCFLLTGIYVRRANSEFDSLTNEIKDEVKYFE